MSELKQGKILIVDDNEDLLKAAKMYGVQERNAESYATLSREVARANVDIDRVVVDVSGNPHRDPAAEFDAIMSEQ